MPVNIDGSMLELFRSEAEIHLAALNDGLLTLEADASRSDLFEGMMRAAHSIKGAAKIVGLPAAVAVAHVMEDCFVAVGAGKVAMTSGLVDVLLEGVDLLARAADVDDGGNVALDAADASIAKFTARLTSAMQGMVDAPIPRGAVARPPQIAQVRAPARLDRVWAEALHDTLLSNKRIDSQELDFADVESIDAVALGFLAAMAQQPVAGQRIVSGARPELQRLLHLAGVATPSSAQPGET